MSSACLALFLASGCGRSSVGEHEQGIVIDVSSAEPGRVDLGSLEPGQSRIMPIRLRNNSSTNVSVGRYESSCPCVRLEGPFRAELGAGRSAGWRLVFDPREDPDFRGSLRVRVETWDVANRPAATLLVSLQVR